MDIAERKETMIGLSVGGAEFWFPEETLLIHGGGSLRDGITAMREAMRRHGLAMREQMGRAGPPKPAREA